MTRSSKIALGIVVSLASGLLVAGIILVRRARPPIEEYIRARVVSGLSKHFAADVQLSALHISISPQLHVVGEGLVLSRKDAPAAPPLVSVRKFVLEGALKEIFQPVPHFKMLTVTGLEMHIPPHHPGVTASHPTTEARLNFTIDAITTSDAEIDILRASAEKPTLVFAIHKLKIKSYQPNHPAAFHATLQNPRPIGEIEVDGTLGPWDTSEPSLTPMNGTYQYKHADLGTFPGISGLLSSKGEFDGELDYISVRGTTQIPDFTLAAAGHPMALNTEFDAIVDGTNGNTYLNSVNAHFLHTSLLISGEIAKSSGQEDRKISLKVNSESARVEDLLKLATKSKSPMLTGDAALNTKVDLRLHQGQNIFDRLALAGRFGITSAKFSSPDTQSKINNLSERALGQPGISSDGDSISDFNGAFTLKKGTMDFSNLQFAVAGAAVKLDGSYDLRGESLDFHGTLRMDAKLSQTTTGAKSVLLKFVDPFFSKNGAGTLLPIKIQGSRENPSFGVEFHRNNPKTSN
jgi:uncharacterized protein involved in outer membrane biogenesis